MPRKARIDAPGALHHIICRGIEQAGIFRDDADRESFVERLGRMLSETNTPCYAWAFIPNHFHLLLKTGRVSITTVMRKHYRDFVEKGVLMGRRSDLTGGGLIRSVGDQRTGNERCDVAQKLKVCNSVVSRSVVRGEKIVADMKLKLIKH